MHAMLYPLGRVNKKKNKGAGAPLLVIVTRLPDLALRATRFKYYKSL